MGIVKSVLVGAALLLALMIIKRKKYNLSIKKVLIMHIIVTIITAFGAILGAWLNGEEIGLRLYGMLILDTVAMLILPKVFKIEVGSLGDYLAAPIIAVCAIVKIPCLLNGCCYGKVLFVDALGNSVRFPSQIVEFSVWVILSVWIILLEHRGNHKNLLWSIATIWFGVLRFLVDFMRGNPDEMKLIILGLPAGRFWSLLAAAMGIAFMVYSLRKYYNCNPSIPRILRTAVGLRPVKE